jgi:hypothetical protein
MASPPVGTIDPDSKKKPEARARTAALLHGAGLDMQAAAAAETVQRPSLQQVASASARQEVRPGLSMP